MLHLARQPARQQAVPVPLADHSMLTTPPPTHPPTTTKQGGVLRRPGHTEASVDLCRLAGCSPAGVLCEMVNPDGTMSRTPELLAFAHQHGLKCITIADLARYRLKHDQLVERTAVGELKTRCVLGVVGRSVECGVEGVMWLQGAGSAGQEL